MVWQNTHQVGKPAGLSLPDLRIRARPAAYLTVTVTEDPPTPAEEYAWPARPRREHDERWEKR